MPRLLPRDRRGCVAGETSQVVRARVTQARDRQRRRLAGAGVTANAHLTARGLRELCTLEPGAVRALDDAYDGCA